MIAEKRILSQRNAAMTQHEATINAGRRDFVVHAAVAFVYTGCATALWPLVAQMAPNRATPLPGTVDVDLRGIRPGGMKLVRLRATPVFVRRRTREEVEQARATPLASLPDQLARNAMLPETAPAFDSNRTQEGHEEWLVVTGLCTHLGCRLTAAATDTAGEAWLCPCHAARFDVAGRVRAGPARTNLPVPRYEFLRADKIRIG
jgi:ubiquinol-cytochrome c reductase iron-sulfur subunit